MGRCRAAYLAAKIVDFAFDIIGCRADTDEDHGCAALLTRLSRVGLDYACHGILEPRHDPSSASTVPSPIGLVEPRRLSELDDHAFRLLAHLALERAEVVLVVNPRQSHKPHGIAAR